jgi:hypothetical protein
MRTFLIALLVIVFAAAAFAGPGCGGCSGKSVCTAAAKLDLSAAPTCAPDQLKAFHTAFMLVREGRDKSDGSAIRTNAEALFKAAKAVPGSKACCAKMDKKQFKTAAKDLVKDCDRLRELSVKGSPEILAAQVTVVEEDYRQLRTLCE